MSIIKWNYESELPSSSGYENVLDSLRNYTKTNYVESSEERKTEIIKEVFEIYRNVNIFPITYYSQAGVSDEIKKCVEKEVSLSGSVLDLKFNQGQSLCRFLFPNMQDVVVKGIENNSPFHKFYDDHKLYRAIKFCLDHKSVEFPVVPSAIKDGLEMLGGGVATNFKSMNAKALYEKYVPEGGVIYDFACGFGGRMLGALSSKNNYKYFGVEPCVDTFNNLNILGNSIELATNRENVFKVFNIGSEDIAVKSNSADFAFSSPPYFSLEKYSEEETQCYNKFPKINDWFIGYVEPTIRHIYRLLKSDRFYCVNIADFNIGKTRVEYVDKWIQISKACGFEYVEQIHMKLQTRRGNGHDESNTASKKEGIFVFYKR